MDGKNHTGKSACATFSASRLTHEHRLLPILS